MVLMKIRERLDSLFHETLALQVSYSYDKFSLFATFSFSCLAVVLNLNN